MKSSGKLALEHKQGKPRIIKYLPYPFSYGFIPNTLLTKEKGGDGDPLDAIIIGNSLERGKVAPVKVIGILSLLDRGEQDDKIITISQDSPLYFINDITQLDKDFPGISLIIRTWFQN